MNISPDRKRQQESFLSFTTQIPFCDCIIWEGRQNESGYGKIDLKINSKRKAYRAHRISYALFIGAIPNNLHVLHKCDNRLCVNPKHLFLGTHQENMQDMKNKKRAKAWKGEENSGAKLTEKEVLNIRASINIPILKLAQQYNVSKTAIERILNRKTWKHL